MTHILKCSREEYCEMPKQEVTYRHSRQARVASFSTQQLLYIFLLDVLDKANIYRMKGLRLLGRTARLIFSFIQQSGASW